MDRPLSADTGASTHVQRLSSTQPSMFDDSTELMSESRVRDAEPRDTKMEGEGEMDGGMERRRRRHGRQEVRNLKTRSAIVQYKGARRSVSRVPIGTAADDASSDQGGRRRQ